MARNGSGTYNRIAGVPYVYNTTIDQTVVNAEFDDIAAALTGSIAKDGQTTPTANLPMGTFRHTNVGAASARTHYARAAEVQDSALTWCGTAGGTADAFTLSPSIAITAYAAGQAFQFVAVGTNTGPVTVNVSGVGAKAVQVSGSALSGGEVVSGKLYSIRYDGTQFQLEQVSVSQFIATLLNDADAATARATLEAQAADALLTSLAGQTVTANKIQAYSGADTASLLDFKDEDDMASNSATAVPSQQSVKAYVDANGGGTSGTAQASTSGTAIDFTSIPAGTNQIIIMFNGVSTNGTSNWLVQIGDSGGIEATGYAGGANVTTGGGATAGGNFTTGYGIYSNLAAHVLHGHMILTHVGSNVWVSSHSLGASNGTYAFNGGGAKTLSAELDRVRITTVSGDTFDAGSINIIYS